MMDILVISGYQRSGTIAFGQSISAALGIPVLAEVFLDIRTGNESFFAFLTQQVRSGRADCYPCYADLHRSLEQYWSQLRQTHGERFILHVKADQYFYLPFLEEHLREFGAKFICLYRNDNLRRLLSVRVLDSRVAKGLPAHDTEFHRISLEETICLDTTQFVRAVERDTSKVRAFVRRHALAGDQVLSYETQFEEGGLAQELERLRLLYDRQPGVNVPSDAKVVRNFQRAEDLFPNFLEIESALADLGRQARFIDLDQGGHREAIA